MAKNSFCVGFFVFLTFKQLLRIFTCSMQNKVVKTFKTARHVVQNKENKFPVMSSVCLYVDRSWGNDQSQRTYHSLHFVTFNRNLITIFFTILGFFCRYQMKAQMTYNKKNTIKPSNKAPRRTLLFGSFVSFAKTVPSERPPYFSCTDLHFSCSPPRSLLSLNGIFGLSTIAHF